MFKGPRNYKKNPRQLIPCIIAACTMAIRVVEFSSGGYKIFYFKNHPNLSQFFFSLKNTNLEAHFLLLAFFDKINFLTTLLLKLGQIFDEVAKLGKSTQDAYNPGKWLIL